MRRVVVMLRLVSPSPVMTLIALGTSILYFLVNLRFLDLLPWSSLTQGWSGIFMVGQCLLQMAFPGVLALFFYIFYINQADEAEDDEPEEPQDE